MVKFTASGYGTRKYVLSFWVTKIALLTVYLFNVLVPEGRKFLELLQEMMNTSHWELITLLTPIFWMIVYWMVTEVVMAFIALTLMARLKSKYS